MIEVIPGTCWWCGASADSREHKFKRSDLVREHGAAPYVGSAMLSGVSHTGDPHHMRSNRSDPLKFKPNLCQRCNNTRSQPFDNAYDEFVAWIFANEQLVLDSRSLDLDAVFGAKWRSRGLDLLRYFVKHICCRIADLVAGGYETAIPSDVIAFLNGGASPRTLMCEFLVEPALLRWAEMRPDDPLWAPRPLWVDVIFGPDPNGTPAMLQSRWRYGWLTFAWALGPDANGTHPFSSRTLPVPFLARSWEPLFELALASGRFDEQEPARSAQTPDPDPEAVAARAARMGCLWDSPIALAFVAGALDFEASIRGRAPDERRNASVDAATQVSIDRELRRVRLLVGACSNWAASELDEASLRAAARSDRDTDVEGLVAMSAQMHSRRVNSEPLAGLRSDFACLATLRLASAYELGPGSPAGQAALIEAARLAGCCVIAAALAEDDLGAGFAAIMWANEALADVGGSLAAPKPS